MLSTTLSVRDIQLAIINNSGLCDVRNDLICPNVSWGLLPYEADLLVVRKSGTVLEFEIKRSFQDFKKDFEKFHSHDADLITYFYYVLPEKIEEKVKKFLIEKFETPDKCPEVILYNDESILRWMHDENKIFGNAKRKNYNKITDEQKATLGRLISIRYWNVLNEISPNGFSTKDIKIKSLNESIKRLTKENKELYSLKGSGEWISTMKELPDDDRLVLVRFWSGNVDVAHCLKSYAGASEDSFWTDVDGKEISRYITYWAEIPAFQN